MIHRDQIKQLIEAGLPDCQAQVSGEDGSHFEAIIISAAFAGKMPVKRQQMVYATLGDRISNGEIHALAMRTYTPEEWATAQT